jgi:proline iminopeptidase
MECQLVAADDGTKLHVGVTGRGPDVVMLSGGPGCAQYLEDDSIAPSSASGPGTPNHVVSDVLKRDPHTLDQAVTDLESIRRFAGVDALVGHSWGSDLARRLCP